MLACFLFFSPGCGDPGDASFGGVPDDEPRLVVMSPGLAMILRDLGLADRIVGRHGYDRVTPSSVEVAGDETRLDYEALLRVNPTAVILQDGGRPTPERLTDLARERGWAIHRVPVLALDDVRSAIGTMDRLGRGAGAEGPEGSAASERARELVRSFDAALAERAGLAERMGRTLVLGSTDPPGAMGPGSFHYELVARLGAEPAPAAGSAWMNLSVEDVVRLDPDSLVLVMPGAPEWADGGGDRGGDRGGVLGRLSEVGLRAVSTGRVVVVRDEHGQLPSTSLIGVAQRVAEAGLGWEPIGGGADG